MFENWTFTLTPSFTSNAEPSKIDRVASIEALWQYSGSNSEFSADLVADSPVEFGLAFEINYCIQLHTFSIQTPNHKILKPEMNDRCTFHQKQADTISNVVVKSPLFT